MRRLDLDVAEVRRWRRCVYKDRLRIETVDAGYIVRLIDDLVPDIVGRVVVVVIRRTIILIAIAEKIRDQR
jgi:hypothetical protein